MPITIDSITKAITRCGRNFELLQPETKNRLYYAGAAAAAKAIPESETIRYATLGVGGDITTQSIKYSVVTATLIIDGKGTYSKRDDEVTNVALSVRFRSDISSVNLANVDGYFVENFTRQRLTKRTSDSEFIAFGRPVVHFRDGHSVDLLSGTEDFKPELAMDLFAEVCKLDPGEDDPELQNAIYR